MGNHTLECDGSIRQARYRDSIKRKFDGVQLLGPSGCKAYTSSVLNILKNANIIQKNQSSQAMFKELSDRRLNMKKHNYVPTRNSTSRTTDVDRSEGKQVSVTSNTNDLNY